MSLQLSSAEQEYIKDLNLKRDDVKSVFEWVKKQPYLPEITELQVILFLHSCYYKTEAAKRTIDNYFTARTRYRDIFECASEDVIRRASSVTFSRILPKKTSDGDIILLIKLIDYKPKNYVSVEHIKVSVMTTVLYLHLHGPPNGLILLVDMKGAAFGHLFRINVMVIKRILRFFQDAAPVRIKGIHFINVVPLTEKLVAIMKPFMKNELVELIKLHSTSVETLYNYVPKECLLEEYGGELSSLENLNEENIQNLLNNMSFFKWHDSQKVDETKRNT